MPSPPLTSQQIERLKANTPYLKRWFLPVDLRLPNDEHDFVALAGLPRMKIHNGHIEKLHLAGGDVYQVFL